MKKIRLALWALSLPLWFSCKNGSEDKAESHVSQAQVAADKKRVDEVDRLNNEYRDIPDAKILDNGGENSPVYTELKKRYKEQLAQLKKEVEATGAKFVVVMITPEVGPGITNLTRYGHPYIKSTCDDLGIEVYDLSAAIAAQPVNVVTLAPKDGHWSKKGSIFLAGQLAPVIAKHVNDRSKTTYKDSERPETFGDLAPNQDEVLDGGKDLPYHLKANAQGLRMDHDIKFPKTKQHVLFMGGSQIYSPFLDNEFIATSLLAKQFPNSEIMNSAMLSGCTDDFLSLWEEKAKYSEPDVVIVQTNGTDITDLFFTNRNHLARSHKPYYPTPVEEAYFKEKFMAK